MEQRQFSLSTYLQDPIALLWRFWASARLSLALLSFCLLAILASLILPQASPQIQGDPVAYGRWLAGVRGRYGPGVDAARALGLLQVRNSFGFRSLLVALAFNLILNTVEQMQRLTALARWKGPPEESEFRQEWTAAHSLAHAEAMERLRAYLKKKRLCLREEMNEGQPARLLAWRLPWGHVFRLLPHLGILLVLGGLLVTERWGWQEIDLPLGKGQLYAVGHDTDLTLSGESIAVSLLSDGAPAAWQSEVALSHNGQEVRRGLVRSGVPLYYRGLLLCQSDLGPSVEATAQDESGQPVIVQTLPLQAPEQKRASLRFRNNGDEGYFAVPGRNLSLRLTYYTSLPQYGEPGPVVHVQAYRGGQTTPLWDTFLRDEATWILDNTKYYLRLEHYAILQIVFAPGWPLMVAGVALIVLGSWGILGSSLRAWQIAIVEQKGEILARLYYDGISADSASERWFQRLQREIAGLLHE